MSSELSIIIPTHNSASTIERCIRSLTSQSYARDRYEIIVVDDGSKDGTIDLSKKAGADKVIETEPCFQGKARNTGAENAEGKFLAFIDSDCEAKKGWIESIITELEQKHAVTGPIHNANSDSAVAWAEYFLEFGGFHQFRKFSAVRFLPGCNQGITKEAFQKTAGFSESRISEDVVFGQSLKDAGIEPFFSPQVQISHLCRTEMSKVSANMKMLGKYSVRARKINPKIKYGTLMSNRIFIPILFLGMIGKAACYSIEGKNFGRFLTSFSNVVLGTKSFCEGIWEELGTK